MTDKVAGPDGSALSEGLGPLRELATEGAALHGPGQPERMICDGLLAALDEVARLRALLHEVVAFQSAPTSPTIHDFGRWRRAADGLGA